MKKRFYETTEAFARRCDLAAAKAHVAGKKLWRISAIQMHRLSDGGWKMGMIDHFTVEACNEEMAIGVFKYRNNRMDWFVIDIADESVSR